MFNRVNNVTVILMLMFLDSIKFSRSQIERCSTEYASFNKPVTSNLTCTNSFSFNFMTPGTVSSVTWDPLNGRYVIVMLGSNIQDNSGCPGSLSGSSFGIAITLGTDVDTRDGTPVLVNSQGYIGAIGIGYAVSTVRFGFLIPFEKADTAEESDFPLALAQAIAAKTPGTQIDVAALMNSIAIDDSTDLYYYKNQNNEGIVMIDKPLKIDSTIFDALRGSNTEVGSDRYAVCDHVYKGRPECSPRYEQPSMAMTANTLTIEVFVRI